MASSSEAGNQDNESPVYNLYHITTKQSGGNDPHWYLVTVEDSMGPMPRNVKSTYYHTNDGPTSPNNAPYRVAIQKDRNIRSEKLEFTALICGGLTEDNIAFMKRAANKIRPHHCQKFVVCLLAELERKGIVPVGNAARLAAEVKMSELTRTFEGGMNPPPPDPVGIELPASWPRGSPPTSPEPPAGTMDGKKSRGALSYAADEEVISDVSVLGKRTRADYEETTVRCLRDICKSRGIGGYSKLRKAQVIALLVQQDLEEPVVEEGDDEGLLN